jgi:hypothetical protein
LFLGVVVTNVDKIGDRSLFTQIKGQKGQFGWNNTKGRY